MSRMTTWGLAAGQAGNVRMAVLAGLFLLVLGAAAGLSLGYLIWGPAPAGVPPAAEQAARAPATAQISDADAGVEGAAGVSGMDATAMDVSSEVASAAETPPDKALLSTPTRASDAPATPPPEAQQDTLSGARPADEPMPPLAGLEAEADLWPARHMVLGIAGTALSPGNAELLADLKPGGIVLRASNLASPQQAKDLVAVLRQAVGLGGRPGSLPIVVLDPAGAGPALGLQEAPTFRELASNRDLTLARQAGVAWGAICRDRGIDALLAPPLDVYREGAHARWKTETFGSDPRAVAAYALAFAEGLMSEGVLPIGRHFPGHGAAREDSRYERALLTGPPSEAVRHLLPFSEAVRVQLPALLVGHIAVPSLNPSAPVAPAALSPSLTQEFLRRRWDYEGVLIADNLASLAVGEALPAAAVKAFEAGNDAMLIEGAEAGLLKQAAAAIEAAVASGRLTRRDLADSVRRLDGLLQWLRQPAPLPGPVPALPPIAQAKPDPVPSAAAAADEAPSPVGSADETATALHVVKPGETWYGLARRYQVSVEELAAMNGVEELDGLQVDQRIRVPAQ